MRGGCYQSLACRYFLRGVFQEQWHLSLCEPRTLTSQLFAWLIRKHFASPDLTMWMRVRATHHLALVLKDLHPSVSLSQVRHLFCPQIHNAANLRGRHLGKREIMTRREAQNPAFASACM